MKQVLCGVMVAAMCLMISSCGSAGNSNASDPGGTDGGGVQTRLASSMAEYFDQVLNQAGKDSQVSESQLSILSDARDHSELTQSAYESAWANYKQCMVDKGQPEPVLDKYSDGLYAQASITGSDEKMDAFSDASSQCEASEVTYVDQLYRVQEDNPELYADTTEAIVDCLHRKNLVPDGYTAKDFTRESGTGDKSAFSFDPMSSESQSCFIANNYGYFDVTDMSAYRMQDLGW